MGNGPSSPFILDAFASRPTPQALTSQHSFQIRRTAFMR
jgi:hypothetical protein